MTNVEDILSLVLFTLAIVALLAIPSRGDSPFSGGAKVFLITAVAANSLVMLADVFEARDLLPVLDQFEGALELLWVPFSAFAVYSLYTRQQVLDARTAKHGVAQANEMLRSIMDTTQTGIVVLDKEGALTFANGAARQLLDLDQSAAEGGGQFTVTTGLDVGHESQRADFAELVTARKLSNVEVTITWPNGWRRRLSVNTEPAVGPDGQVSEVVAAFVEIEPWRTLAAT